MFSALDIAKYIVAVCSDNGNPITNLKLQKMLYYAQGYAYRYCKEPIFAEEICKWRYGPVVPDVYFAYYQFGSEIIVPDVSDWELLYERIRCDNGLKKVVDRVIHGCSCLRAAELVYRTHQEMPWINAQENREISQRTIASFFAQNDPLHLDLVH